MSKCGTLSFSIFTLKFLHSCWDSRRESRFFPALIASIKIKIMAESKLLKMSLILLPILLSVIYGVHCEFAEDSQTVIKNRLTLTEPFQGDGIVEQDDFPDQRQQLVKQVTQPAPSHRIWIPADGVQQMFQNRVVKDPELATLNNDKPMNPRRKKECGFPVLRRRLFGNVMKRSSSDKHYFANSEDEVQEKIKEEDVALQEGLRKKRSDVSESHSGGCIAKRQWIDMGADYYPRYVKSYHCSSSTCDRGFGTLGECKPKHYTTKVLKRITPADITSVEDCDQTLPEALRVDWKLISVTVTTCCDCMSPAARIFGLK